MKCSHRKKRIMYVKSYLRKRNEDNIKMETIKI